MAHFAKVVNNIVETVIVGDDDLFTTDKHIWVVGGGGNARWIQTSYNTRRGVYLDPITMQPKEDQSKALRKNFAAPGYTYDSERDAFYPPKPYPSWVLNEDTCWWTAPTPYPSDGKYYEWDEENGVWDEQLQDKYRTTPIGN